MESDHQCVRAGRSRVGWSTVMARAPLAAASWRPNASSASARASCLQSQLLQPNCFGSAPPFVAELGESITLPQRQGALQPRQRGLRVAGEVIEPLSERGLETVGVHPADADRQSGIRARASRGVADHEEACGADVTRRCAASGSGSRRVVTPQDLDEAVAADDDAAVDQEIPGGAAAAARPGEPVGRPPAVPPVPGLDGAPSGVIGALTLSTLCGAQTLAQGRALERTARRGSTSSATRGPSDQRHASTLGQ